MAVTELTSELFNESVQKPGILIIDFWAEWCGPCKQFAPIFDAAAEKYADIHFAKVNTEEQLDLAQAFKIRSIPTLMIFRDQVLLYSQAGALSAGQLDELITQVQGLDMAEIHAEIAAQQQNSAS